MDSAYVRFLDIFKIAFRGLFRLVKECVIRFTGAQLRAARAAAGLTLKELAEAALIDERTVRRAEELVGYVKMSEASLVRITEALKKCGIKFLPPDRYGGGIRIRDKSPPIK